MSSGSKSKGFYKTASPEKQKEMRDRNTESCRRNRQKWKEHDREIEQLYEQNQKRISTLEKIADKLESELTESSSSSKPSRAQAPKR